MSKKKALIDALRAIAARERFDCPEDHEEADELLLAYIGDEEIRTAYEEISRNFNDAVYID